MRTNENVYIVCEKPNADIHEYKVKRGDGKDKMLAQESSVDPSMG